jgi:FlaG/FlaF family flagellin (archaellin)
MAKGLTPVVATVLLMTVAVAAAGTVYTMVEENIDQGKQGVDQDFNIDQNALSIEQCYQTNGDTLIDVRNTGSEAINASKVTPLLNGSLIQNYRIESEIAGSQEIFSVNFTDTTFGSGTSIILTDGETQIQHTCIGIR